MSATQIIVGGEYGLGVQIVNIDNNTGLASVFKGKISMKVDSSFNPLSGEYIRSMLPLNNGKYLCAVESGSLQLIDITEKTAKLYANKYKGKQVQCIVAFPGFNEDLFPLVLIK